MLSIDRAIEARTHRLQRLLDRWQDRWGDEAVRAYRAGSELYAAGFFIALLSLLIILLAYASPIKYIGLTACIFIGVPLIWASAWRIRKTNNLIILRYRLPKSSRRGLTLKVLKDPPRFDEWLAREQADNK